MTMNTLYEIAQHFQIPLVEDAGIVDDITSFVQNADAEEGNEGYILRFDTGQMLKVKNSWYVQIHKVKDKIRYDRHILAIILDNNLDDILPHLDENDLERIRKLEDEFHTKINEFVAMIDNKAADAINMAAGNRKKLATEVLPNSGIDSKLWGFVFKIADGQKSFDLIMKYVSANIGSNTKYDEMANMIGLTVN